jgi:hypothetical protein
MGWFIVLANWLYYLKGEGELSHKKLGLIGGGLAYSDEVTRFVSLS